MTNIIASKSTPMARKIRRNLMLKELDIREETSGKQRTFSVAFITRSGVRVFLPRAVATGLRFNLKEHRMRGIRPVDQEGNSEGHVYPVSIDNFVEFNSMEVIL